MYQMDAQHTGRSPFEGPRRAILQRTFDTGQAEFRPDDAAAPTPDIQSSIAAGADGTVYVTNYPGYLFALKDGSAQNRLDLAWKFRPPGATPRHSTPALAADGTVYIHFSRGSGDTTTNTLYALKAPTSGTEAQPVWSVDLGPGQTGGPTGLSPTIGPDGAIYQLSPAGKLFVIAPDGKVKWTAQAGPTVKVAPALGSDGTVYTTSLDGKLYALAPPASGSAEGAVRWTFNFGENLGPTPLVTAPVAGPPTRGQDGIGSAVSPTVAPDGTVYAGANNSNFYAVGPDGKMKWLFEAERELAGIWSSACLSADGSTLYFGANKGGIYAVNRADGKLRWQYKIFGSVYSSPALDRLGTVYTGSSVGHVFAIDGASGREIFDHDAGGPVWTAPVIRPDGSLVVADRGGRVHVFGAAR
jgi:outer membrane protein assembly factor BamB